MVFRWYMIDSYLIVSQFSDRLQSSLSNSSIGNNTSLQAKSIVGSANQSSTALVAVSVITYNNSVKAKDVNQNTINNILNVNLNFPRYAIGTIMNWFNIRGRNKSTEEKKIQFIRKRLLMIDRLRDFNFLLKKTSEIDVLKKCLFKDSQILCFKFLDKPQCLNSDNLLYKSLFIPQEDRRKELIEQFSLEYHLNKNHINNTLFSLLEDTIRHDIEKTIVEP